MIIDMICILTISQPYSSGSSMSRFLDLRRLPVPFILSIRGQVDKFTPVLQPFGLPSTVPSPIRLDQHFWMTMGHATSRSASSSDGLRGRLAKRFGLAPSSSSTKRKKPGSTQPSKKRQKVEHSALPSSTGRVCSSGDDPTEQASASLHTELDVGDTEESAAEHLARHGSNRQNCARCKLLACAGVSRPFHASF